MNAALNSQSIPPPLKTHTYTVQVQFGDCDPAGIVFFPNFSKWMDAASLHFFMECGIPPWRELVKTTGIIGTPLVEINTRFLRPATYGETICIDTCIVEWNRKTIKQQHTVRRADPTGDTVLCIGTETRAFCVLKDPLDAASIKAIEVPAFIKTACV
jgi:4-hydroxybenzoyl-CoA thioesterase